MSARAAAALVAATALLGGRPVAAQLAPRVAPPSARVVEAGPGGAGRALRAALAAPHVVRLADAGGAALPRDSAFATTVLVLGGTATVASRVAGDVVVVGGDLFLHPGADIAGRAVAIGGCVYNSTLATVRGERVCFRESGFAVDRDPDGTYALRYAPPAGPARRVLVALPGTFGFQPPAYDRVNGLSLSWGPTAALDTGRVTLDPRVTYRSDLGAVDPSVDARLALGRGYALGLAAARGSYTNEAWIRSDVVNAVGAFAFGTDTRNYYRADRLEARLARAVPAGDGAVDVYVTGRAEDARSVGPDVGATSAPFSVFGRRDRDEGMLRANPQGAAGRVNSALVGATGGFTSAALSGAGAVSVEVPWRAPGGGRWVQVVLDAQTAFPTFGGHTVQAGAHAVVTQGDSTPRQRYAYLGGSGTLQTEALLGQGGDALLYVDGVYLVPLTRLALPFVGAPTVGVRYAAGSAGVRDLPRFTQNVGVRATLGLGRVDLIVNPATGETSVNLGVAVLR